MLSNSLKEKKSKRILVQFEPDQYAKLKILSRRMGLSFSSFLRMVALDFLEKINETKLKHDKERY